MNGRRRLAPELGLAAILCAMFGAGPALADLAPGEEDYRTRCAACHGERGLGDGPIAFYFTAPPPPLAQLAARNDGAFPRERVIAIIDGREWRNAHGGRAMPIWGELFEASAKESLKGEGGDAEALVEERLGQLVDYLKTLQQP
ncbi:MAG: cytochrome c [Pseudomonadota bacterium]